MKRIQVWDTIKASRIIAIIRAEADWPILDIVKALYAGGIRAIEISLNTPNAMAQIENSLSLNLPGLEIGAGTVLDAEAASLAIRTGASFMLMPNLEPDVIKICNQYGVLGIPGVLTPTEIVQAYKLGAQVVKVFPACTTGPQYISNIKGPLPHVEMIPVGGVSLDNIKSFFKAGVSAVGVGGQLIDKKSVLKGDFSKITEKAMLFREISLGNQ